MMDLEFRVRKAVSKNLNILEKGLPFDDQKIENQVFILLSLSALKTPQALLIQEKIFRLLKLKQKDIFSSGDLQEIFSFLIALGEYDPKLINGKLLAQAVALLIQSEEKEGGPYRGDLLTNILIANFLHQQEIDLEGLNRWIESQISKKILSSEEIYFLSRFYKGPRKAGLVDYLLKKLKTGEPYSTALTISALLNFGVLDKQVRAGISYLLKGKQDYLTLAICLEGLQKFLNQVSKQPLVQGNSKDKISEKIYQRVLSLIDQRLLLLEPGLKKETKLFLLKIIEKDVERQIILLPYIFTKALGKSGKGITSALLIQLGLANLYGWLAYTIYDDFLDEEGEPRFLPVANMALRELITIFNNVLPGSRFRSFFNQVMDELEGANSWEVDNCRVKISDGKVLIDKKLLPKYGNFSKLASRSLGHALGPLAILFALGLKEESKEVQTLTQFFRHYLIARQLNDDAHDWEEDLQKGHLNSVATRIFKKYQEPKEKVKIDLSSRELVSLKQFFEQKMVPDICGKTLQHIKLARKYLGQMVILSYPQVLENLLIPVEQAAQNTLQQWEQAEQFQLKMDDYFLTAKG